MNRDYTANEVEQLLKQINTHAPKIKMRTSILVGFPGESDLDYLATKELVNKIGFTEVNINRYEDRPGTASSRMREKVEQVIIENRARDLVETNCHCHLLS